MLWILLGDPKKGHSFKERGVYKSQLDLGLMCEFVSTAPNDQLLKNGELAVE
jgi:hypothetical protein